MLKKFPLFGRFVNLKSVFHASLTILFLVGLEYNGIIKKPVLSAIFSPFVISCFLVISIIGIYHKSLSVISKKNISRELIALSIVILCFMPILLNGPFFQPPSDPVAHGFHLWTALDNSVANQKIPYRLNELLFIFEYKIFEPVRMVTRFYFILFNHVINSIFMISAVYLASRIYGLNKKWSFFSVLTMVLFFGTDRFSFLTYYSLAPAAINFCLYWLFSALLVKYCFHFRLKRFFRNYSFFYTMFLLCLFTPIMFSNHPQEIAFLFYYLVFVFIFLAAKFVSSSFTRKKAIFGFVVFFFLFIPMQFLLKAFPFVFGRIKIKLDPFSDLISNYGTPWYFGRLGSHRIMDTLGIAGVAPVILFIILFLGILTYRFRKNTASVNFRLKYSIPAFLPFFIALVPLNIFLWVFSLHRSDVFWRFTYSTQFWITLAFLLSYFEEWLFSFGRDSSDQQIKNAILSGGK